MQIESSEHFLHACDENLSRIINKLNEIEILEGKTRVEIMLSGLNLLLFTVLFKLKEGSAWTLSFDLIPSLGSEFFPLELKECKVSYWTRHNTECMEGCSVFGELRYGPNYLSGNSVAEIPKSMGIKCGMGGNIGKIDLFDKIGAFDLWIDADICSLEHQTLFDIILKELIQSRNKLYTDNRIKKLHLDSLDDSQELIYIGAFVMHSLNNSLKYREYIKSYIKYSITVDLLLLLLLLLNTLIYKYRLLKIKKIIKDR